MTTIRRLIALGAVLALSAACESSGSPAEPNLEPLPEPNLKWADVGLACSEDDPAVPLTDEQAALLPANPPMIGDDRFAFETRNVPGGWGGMFVADGVAKVYLVDPTKLPEAVAAMTGSIYMPRTPEVALQGRWTFAELNDWKTYLFVTGSLTGVGATSIDAQEAENRLRIGVIDEASRALFEAKLQAIGAPCWLVAIDIQQPIFALAR